MLKKYKLRCRWQGIVITETPEKFDIVWVREFMPGTSPIDAADKLKTNDTPRP